MTNINNDVTSVNIVVVVQMQTIEKITLDPVRFDRFRHQRKFIVQVASIKYNEDHGYRQHRERDKKKMKTNKKQQTAPIIKMRFNKHVCRRQKCPFYS